MAAFALAAFAPQLFNDGDTWWHLAAGGWMLDHSTVLKHDVFSFTFAGRFWDAQEWLSEILMAASFRLGSWSGLHILFGVAFGGAAALVTYYVRARLDAVPALLLCLIGLACVMGSLLARPHLLALPFLAGWTFALLKAREEQRMPSLWLVVLMLAWANLHGSFAFGLALAAALAVEAVLEKPAAWRGWTLFLLAALLTAALTPEGGAGLLFPFKLLALQSIRNVGEWAPADLRQPGPFAIALLGLVVLVVMGKMRLPGTRAMLVLGLAYLALAHVRHQMLFGIVVPMLITPRLAKHWPPQEQAMPRWLAPLGAGLLALLLLARIALPATRHDDRATPITALAHVPPALRSQPVLNAYDFGGYLIFSGVKVFVDGRTDMYGDAFLENYDRMMRPDRDALTDTLRLEHIAWTILPPGAAARVMDTLPGWRRSYSDAFAVVHVRNP